MNRPFFGLVCRGHSRLLQGISREHPKSLRKKCFCVQFWGRFRPLYANQSSELNFPIFLGKNDPNSEERGIYSILYEPFLTAMAQILPFLFGVLLIEIQEEIRHFCWLGGWGGGGLRGAKIVNKNVVNKLWHFLIKTLARCFSLGKQARNSHGSFVPECPCEKFMNRPFFGLVCRGHSRLLQGISRECPKSLRRKSFCVQFWGRFRPFYANQSSELNFPIFLGKSDPNSEERGIYTNPS